MAKIFPFKGVLYNPKKVSDLQAVMTPPYDIISPEAQERFYERHPYSMIRLDLGRQTPQDTEQDNRYTRANRHFQQWLSEGVLAKDSEEALYLYRIQYRYDGEEKEIRGFIALTELEEFGKGSVIPHEYTLSGPKTDRLNLLRACQANFSLIYSLYPPEGGTSLVGLMSETVQGNPPRVDVRDDDGVRHTLWSITDPALVGRIQKALEGKSVYIADGHHRYETSVNYRNERKETEGTSSGQESYNRVMMFFTETSERGLTILPTHRLVFNLSEDRIRHFEDRVGDCFSVTPYPYADRNEPEVRKRMLHDLVEKGRSAHVFGLCSKGRQEYRLLAFKDESLLDREGAADHSAGWRRLDVSILQTFVLERLLGIQMDAVKKESNLHYVRGEEEAIGKVQSGQFQMAFLLNATKMEEIIQVSGTGDRMPQKSTYFYPKLLTGLVINKL
jgi:uncharacterized protein (DUF1015 family)